MAGPGDQATLSCGVVWPPPSQRWPPWLLLPLAEWVVTRMAMKPVYQRRQRQMTKHRMGPPRNRRQSSSSGTVYCVHCRVVVCASTCVSFANCSSSTAQRRCQEHHTHNARQGWQQNCLQCCGCVPRRGIENSKTHGTIMWQAATLHHTTFVSPTT